jgi:hypothetical protein
MFIEFIEAHTRKPRTINVKEIITFRPNVSGNCSVTTTDGEVTFVEGTYQEVKEILIDLFI